jgi:hypothetical protein
VSFKYFNVKNGLTTGNISLHAANANVQANYFLGNINVTSSANLGAVGNVKITGGASGYILSTDGTGNLSWTAQGSSNIVLDSFTGNGVQTDFTLSSTPSSEDYTIINIDGVSQLHSAYTVSGANVILSSPPANGAAIEVMTFNLSGGGGGGGSSGSNIANGTSNVSIATSNGNVTTSVAGTANVLVVSSLGIGVNGTITGTSLISNIATGTAPLTVTSTTQVANLNAATAGLATYATTANAVAGANVSGQVSNALVAGTVYTASQPNITSVGTLTDLSVSGNGVIGGNLTVNGTLTYINSTTLAISDPIINLQTGANGAAPIANSGKDVGTALNYYDTSAKIAWMGWDVSNAEIAFGSNVGITSEVVTFTSLANIRSGNAQLGNAATANFFIGSGNNLSNIQGANVTGAVSSATTAGTVTTAAQPNITSVGTLTSLAVTGTTTSGNFATAGNITASFLVSNVATGTAPLTITSTTRVNNLNVAYANVSDYSAVTTATTGNYYLNFVNALTGNVQEYANTVFVANVANGAITATTFVGALSGAATSATTAGTVTTAAQPNITSVGTLTSLAVTGNISAGNVSATTFTGALSGAATSATTAGTVTTAAQPNITSVGSLTGLTVSNATGVVNFTTTANVTLGAVANLHISGGTNGQYLQTNGSGTLSWATVAVSNISNGNSNVNIPTSNGNINLTAVGNTTLVVTGTGINVAGTLNATGNANVGNIGATGGVFTTVAGSLTTASQPNITSVGTLTSLTVTGNTTSGNLITSGTVNKVTVTQPTNSATLTIADGASLITSGAFSTTLTSTATTNATLPPGTYKLGYLNVPQSGGADKTGSYTLATTDVGQFISIGSGGSIVVPNAVFSTGDAISIYNNTSANATITCSIANAYISGTDSVKASVTLATRGVTTLLFISSSVCVLAGSIS